MFNIDKVCTLSQITHPKNYDCILQKITPDMDHHLGLRNIDDAC